MFPVALVNSNSLEYLDLYLIVVSSHLDLTGSRYWVFEVEVLHDDGRVERQLTRIDARTSSATESAIGGASTDAAVAPTLLSVVGASLTALQSIPAALRDAAADSSARAPSSTRAAPEFANPIAAASSSGTSSLASPPPCRASAVSPLLNISRDSACFVAFETARADSSLSSSSESANLRRVFESRTPPVFQRHPWVAASSSSSAFSLASTPTFATAAATTLIAAQSLPSSSASSTASASPSPDALRWALTIKLPPSSSSSSSSSSSTGVRVRVFGVPDLRELLLPPPVDAEAAPWMRPPLYASSSSSSASAASASPSLVHCSHMLSARGALLAASSSSHATTGRTGGSAAHHRRSGANADSSGASEDGDGSASDASDAAGGGGGASNEDSSVFDGSFLDAGAFSSGSAVPRLSRQIQALA